METKIATKFVVWEVPALETLRDTKTYKLRIKVNSNKKLSRDEKDWITKQVNGNAYFKNAIPLQGWRFDFSDILRTYIVKQYGEYREYNATDKTALRKIIHGSIQTIINI